MRHVYRHSGANLLQHQVLVSDLDLSSHSASKKKKKKKALHAWRWYRGIKRYLLY